MFHAAPKPAGGHHSIQVTKSPVSQRHMRLEWPAQSPANHAPQVVRGVGCHARQTKYSAIVANVHAAANDAERGNASAIIDPAYSDSVGTRSFQPSRPTPQPRLCTGQSNCTGQL